jgi:hypothetical protein
VIQVGRDPRLGIQMRPVALVLRSLPGDAIAHFYAELAGMAAGIIHHRSVRVSTFVPFLLRVLLSLPFWMSAPGDASMQIGKIVVMDRDIEVLLLERLIRSGDPKRRRF